MSERAVTPESEEDDLSTLIESPNSKKEAARARLEIKGEAGVEKTMTSERASTPESEVVIHLAFVESPDPNQALLESKERSGENSKEISNQSEEISNQSEESSESEEDMLPSLVQSPGSNIIIIAPVLEQTECVVEIPEIIISECAESSDSEEDTLPDLVESPNLKKETFPAVLDWQEQENVKKPVIIISELVESSDSEDGILPALVETPEPKKVLKKKRKRAVVDVIILKKRVESDSEEDILPALIQSPNPRKEISGTQLEKRDGAIHIIMDESLESPESKDILPALVELPDSKKETVTALLAKMEREGRERTAITMRELLETPESEDDMLPELSESSEPEDEPSHALLQNKVVDKLFTFFNTSQLQSCVAVCRVWRPKARACLKLRGKEWVSLGCNKRQEPRVPTHVAMERSLHKIIGFLDFTRSFANVRELGERFHQLQLYEMDLTDELTLRLFEVVGSEIVTLRLVSREVPFTNEELYQLTTSAALTSLVRLECEIDLKLLPPRGPNESEDFFLIEKLQLISLHVSDTLFVESITEFINSAPNLERLEIINWDQMYREDFDISEEGGEPGLRIATNMVNKMNLKNLKSYYSNFVGVTNAELHVLMDLTWELRSLQLEIDGAAFIDREVLKFFLSHSSFNSTLENLMLELSGIGGRVIHIPGMKNLKGYTMMANNLRHFQCIENFADNVKFPKLIEINFDSDYFVGDYDNALFNWNNFLPSPSVSCTNITTITLPNKISDKIYVERASRIFRNLKTLKLSDPSKEVLTAVFKHFPSLTGLKILYYKAPGMLDSVLTGLSPKICQTMVRKQMFIFKDSSTKVLTQPSLKDLTALQSLWIHSYSKEPFCTDATIYHGLKHLTKAEEIYMDSCDVSHEAVKSLAASIFPRCMVNIVVIKTAESRPPVRRRT